MKVLITEINEKFCKEKYQFLQTIVDENSKIRLSSFRLYKDSLRTLFGELQIRLELNRNYNIENKDILIKRNRFGKPYLLNNYRVQFNISHSGDYVICGVDSQPVGVDIEVMSDIDFSVSNIFLDNDEQKHLFSLQKKERLDFFYQRWSLKESYIKAIGEGFSKEIFSFKLIKNEGSYKVCDSNTCLDWKLFTTKYNNSHMIGICTKNELSDIIELSMDDIYTIFRNTL